VLPTPIIPYIARSPLCSARSLSHLDHRRCWFLSHTSLRTSQLCPTLLHPHQQPSQNVPSSTTTTNVIVDPWVRALGRFVRHMSPMARHRIGYCLSPARQYPFAQRRGTPRRAQKIAFLNTGNGTCLSFGHAYFLSGDTLSSYSICKKYILVHSS
jgi:hypothetical protein